MNRKKYLLYYLILSNKLIVFGLLFKSFVITLLANIKININYNDEWGKFSYLSNYVIYIYKE